MDSKGHEVQKFKTKVNKSLLQPFLVGRKGFLIQFWHVNDEDIEESPAADRGGGHK